MIKVLEEQDFEILLGEEISDTEEILYEISSEEESSDEEEYIFMMHQNEDNFQNNIQEIPQDELDNIRLKDVIGGEATFTESELAKFEKMQTLSIPQIYKLPKFKFFSARVFEQYCGNTKAQLSSDGKVDIALFDKKKIARWKQKYPDIQYIHIGLIQVTITALFRQGIDTPILAVIFDKRFSEPMKAIIGGIQSNMANGVIWFNIRPNFFISVNDPNIEDTVRMRIKTRGINMKSDSHDLSIRWKTIHELTRFTETRIKHTENKSVEIFEPRPFDSVIQPRLINWSDLEIPKQWLISDLVEEKPTKRLQNILEMQASGRNLYIQNRRPSTSVFERDFKNNEASSSNNRNIAVKNVQIPILPGSLFKEEEEIKSACIYHLQTKNDEIIFSPNQGKKRHTYVQGTFNFAGYKPYSLSVLMDTGATTSSCKWNAIPKEKWNLMKNPILVTGIDGNNTTIQFKAKDIPIWLGENKFIIPKILCFPYMHGDFLLGNNFLYKYLPMHIYEKGIALTVKNTLVQIPLLEQYKHICHKDFSPIPRGEMTPIINIIDESHWIYKILKENFSENPLNR